MTRSIHSKHLTYPGAGYCNYYKGIGSIEKFSVWHTIGRKVHD